jgi:hypothetical protein
MAPIIIQDYPVNTKGLLSQNSSGLYSFPFAIHRTKGLWMLIFQTSVLFAVLIPGKKIEHFIIGILRFRIKYRHQIIINLECNSWQRSCVQFSFLMKFLIIVNPYEINRFKKIFSWFHFIYIKNSYTNIMLIVLFIVFMIFSNFV